MKNTTKLLIAITILLLSATLVVAQHDHAAMQKQGASAEMGEENCPHVAAVRAALDKMDKAVAAGLQANDPAKMKASLTEAQAQVAEAKKHMNQCPMLGGKHEGGMEHHMDHTKAKPEGSK